MERIGNNPSIRESVIRYGERISMLTDEMRRWLSAAERTPERTEILERTEDMFFSTELPLLMGIDEYSNIIGSVVARVASRYGILTDLLEDPSINEIMVNGPARIFIEKDRELMQVDNAFVSEAELEEIIRMFASDVHREINEVNPIVDARLPDGYRVNGVLKTVALNGPILTIRKFREDPIELDDLVRFGSMTGRCADDLRALVRSGYNIFISGGTSSGKTTFLNALTGAIEPHERVIIIEDSAELQITHVDNKVHLECRSANSIGRGEVTMERLIRTSLRMRPDRIIVGEVRGSEVVDMIQAMNTGHDGSMSTGHGNSIRGMLNRLETMYLSGSQISVDSVRNQIANAVDIFVHLRRDSAGRRRVSEVAELTGYDGSDYCLNYLYTESSTGELTPTGNALADRERLMRSGMGELKRERSVRCGSHACNRRLIYRCHPYAQRARLPEHPLHVHHSSRPCNLISAVQEHCLLDSGRSGDTEGREICMSDTCSKKKTQIYRRIQGLPLHGIDLCRRGPFHEGCDRRIHTVT